MEQKSLFTSKQIYTVIFLAALASIVAKYVVTENVFAIRSAVFLIVAFAGFKIVQNRNKSQE